VKGLQEAFQSKYPSKPTIYFVKPHRRLSAMYCEGTPDYEAAMAAMYSHVEVPYEIVKHIYEQGWLDAELKMHRVLNGEEEK
jgi:hypothetical protein